MAYAYNHSTYGILKQMSHSQHYANNPHYITRLGCTWAVNDIKAGKDGKMQSWDDGAATTYTALQPAPFGLDILVSCEPNGNISAKIGRSGKEIDLPAHLCEGMKYLAKPTETFECILHVPGFTSGAQVSGLFRRKEPDEELEKKAHLYISQAIKIGKWNPSHYVRDRHVQIESRYRDILYCTPSSFAIRVSVLPLIFNRNLSSVVADKNPDVDLFTDIVKTKKVLNVAGYLEELKKIGIYRVRKINTAAPYTFNGTGGNRVIVSDLKVYYDKFIIEEVIAPMFQVAGHPNQATGFLCGYPKGSFEVKLPLSQNNWGMWQPNTEYQELWTNRKDLIGRPLNITHSGFTKQGKPKKPIYNSIDYETPKAVEKKKTRFASIEL